MASSQGATHISGEGGRLGRGLEDLAPDDERPLHHQVADALRRAMDSGLLGPMDRVPGENTLMQRYGVSRWTSREALATLASEGLITKVPKVGTFVRERPTVQRHGLERYARSRWQGQNATTILRTEATEQGKEAGRVIRELAEVTAPASVADRLNTLPKTLVWTRRRTVFLNGRPSQLADSYYPLDVVADTALLTAETGPGGDFARLDEAGHTPSRIREEWQARMPTASETAELQLPPGTPVLDFIRTIVDQMGRPVEVMLSVIAADTASFVYDFPVPD